MLHRRVRGARGALFSELEVVMMRRITIVAAAVLLAAACADTDTSPGDGTDVPELPGAQPGGETPAEAQLPPDDGDLRTVDATLTEWSVTLSPDNVAAGAVAFNVRNTGSMVHRFEIEGNGEEWVSEDIPPGEEVTMSVNLSPGAYEVYCPIVNDGNNHEALGMTTTLSVR